MSERSRGQLVLLAAVAVAVALVPMLLALLQLGYQPAISGPDADTLRGVERSLMRALINATAGIPATHDWTNRTMAVDTVRSRLGPVLQALNRSALPRGTVVQVRYNHSLASAWQADRCPSGPARQFGSCDADRGVVIQERAGETHVLAVGLDVDVLGRDRTVAARTVVERT